MAFDKFGSLLSVLWSDFCEQTRTGDIMPEPCSAQKRWQIVTLAEEGYQFKDIARRLREGRNTVGRVMNLYRRTGQVVPGKSTGRPRKTTEREEPPEVCPVAER